MADYETRTIELAVVDKAKGTYSDYTTRVRIDTEGAGEYVVVQQLHSAENGTVAITPGEWPALRAAIDTMIVECRDD